MKKFKSTLPLGTGLKFFDKYLESEMSAEIFDALYAIFDDFKDSTEGFIIKGGTVTGVAPNGIIEESIVVLNGKILRLPETTGLSYPFFIQQAPLQEINGEFNDLIDRPVVDNEFAETAVSAPVSGQYVEVTAAGNYQKGGFAKRIIEDNGTILKTKIVEIGDWDMDTNNSVSVAHGLDLSKIRGVNIMIRSDDSLLNGGINQNIGVGQVGAAIGIAVNGTNVIMEREGYGGLNYNATPFNRGWITIQYEE